MLIFNCTQAAQDFFTVTRKGEKQTIVTAAPGSDMAEDARHLRNADGSPTLPFQWVLHAVSIKRKHCLVAMEVNTRFAVTVAAVKKADLGHFLEYFKQILAIQVADYGLANGLWQERDLAGVMERGLGQMGEAHFFRRSDRSVQTHINEVVLMLRDIADENPAVLEHTAAMLKFGSFTNNKLRKSRAFPRKNYIMPEEEMLVFWQQQFLNATPEQVADIRQRLADNYRSNYRGIIDDIAAPRPSPGQDKPPAGDGPEVFFPDAGPMDGAELAYLDEILAKYATEYSLENASSLHGFLTAIVSAPNMLPPSQWLSEIWGGDDLQPAWGSIGDAQRFMGALFGMMNSISQELMETPQTFGAMFTGSHERPDVSDWCFGYTCGIALDEEAWDEMPDHLQDLVDLIDTYALLLEVNFQSLPPRELQGRANQIIGAATQLHAYWLKQRSPMAPGPVGKPHPPSKPEATQKLVGRNDPCPCGSGKKYKKCCLH